MRVWEVGRGHADAINTANTEKLNETFWVFPVLWFSKRREKIKPKKREKAKKKKIDPARTRTWNPLIRSQMPYPLGHGATHSTSFWFVCYVIRLWLLKEENKCSLLLFKSSWSNRTKKLFLAWLMTITPFLQCAFVIFYVYFDYSRKLKLPTTRVTISREQWELLRTVVPSDYFKRNNLYIG